MHTHLPFVTIHVTNAGIAQLVEHSLRKGQVDGSRPSTSFCFTIMKTPKYTLTNLMLDYIVKYELAIKDIKYNPLPEKYKSIIEEKYATEDIMKMSSLVASPIGYNKALIIQRGQETPSERKKLKIFTNFRNAKDFLRSYNNRSSLKPSIELAMHLNRLILKDVVDDWDVGKLRGFSEKPNEIYDTWYKNRDFYPNLDITAHFNELFDWIQNASDNNHKLIKIGVMIYEFLDKAPFTAGNQITAILVAEILAKKYDYNPDNIFPYFKSIEYISEDLLAAHKMTKPKLDLTPFLEAFLYTISLTSLEVSKEFKDTYTQKVKKQGSLELYLTPRQIQILDFLSLNQKVNRSQLVDLLGVSFMTCFRDVKDMIEKGYLTQKGKGKATFYTLSKKMLEKEDRMVPIIE